MSAQIMDGGPAFPREEVRGTSSTSYEPVQPGMSLRDWFAAHALAGMCANASWDDSFQPQNYPLTAQIAYAMADAMLAARAKGEA